MKREIVEIIKIDLLILNENFQDNKLLETILPWYHFDLKVKLVTLSCHSYIQLCLYDREAVRKSYD